MKNVTNQIRYVSRMFFFFCDTSTEFKRNQNRKQNDSYNVRIGRVGFTNASSVSEWVNNVNKYTHRYSYRTYILLHLLPSFIFFIEIHTVSKFKQKLQKNL